MSHSPISDFSPTETRLSQKLNKKRKVNYGAMRKILSSFKTKQLRTKQEINNKCVVYEAACITPSAHQVMQTWDMEVIPIPNTINHEYNRNITISIEIYALPSIKSLGFEYKFSPYYYFGYGFYGNAYNKNSKQCKQKPVRVIERDINIYDNTAISFNKNKTEIILWRNGVMEDEIKIEKMRGYQFIVESLDGQYKIAFNL